MEIPAEIIFDWCQTIFIAALLVITVPLSSYVYYKLLFSSPFSDNFTFKLIAVYGIAGVISTLIYLFYIQLTSYYFMYWFYKLLEKADLLQAFAIANAYFAGMSINTALFVALNRVKRMLFLNLNGNDSVFFYISMLLSSLLSLPGVLDYCFFTKTTLVEWIFMDDPIFFPSTKTSNPIFFTINNILNVVISVATLVVNLFLALLITREGRYKTDTKRFNAERGLIFTSVSSYVFYTLYLINRVLAQYFKIPLFANAQFLFLGVARLSPAWCLIIFAPSVRRSLFKPRKTITTPIQSTVTKMMLFSPGVYIGREQIK